MPVSPPAAGLPRAAAYPVEILKPNSLQVQNGHRLLERRSATVASRNHLQVQPNFRELRHLHHPRKCGIQLRAMLHRTLDLPLGPD